MENPGLLDENTLGELENILERYPFFQSARLLLTKNLQLTNSESYGEELSKSANLCDDRRKLYYYIHPETYEAFLQANDHGEPSWGDRTEALLNSYFAEFSKKSHDPWDEEAGISIASTDYFTYLESLGVDTAREDTDSQPLQHQDIIDAFIEKTESDSLRVTGKQEKAKSGQAEDKQLEEQTGEQTGEPTGGQAGEPTGGQAEEPRSEISGDFLTETLAKIYIKQKKYEQALTIIKRLSLSFPKKNAYFADQIRFLEYLIINEKNK